MVIEIFLEIILKFLYRIKDEKVQKEKYWLFALKW